MAEEFVRALETFSKDLGHKVRACTPSRAAVSVISAAPPSAICRILKWHLICGKQEGICVCEGEGIYDLEPMEFIAAALEVYDKKADMIGYTIGIGSQFNIGLLALFEGGERGVLAQYMRLNVEATAAVECVPPPLYTWEGLKYTADGFDWILPRYDQSQHWDALQARLRLRLLSVERAMCRERERRGGQMERVLAEELFRALYMCTGPLLAGRDAKERRQELVDEIVDFLLGPCGNKRSDHFLPRKDLEDS